MIEQARGVARALASSPNQEFSGLSAGFRASEPPFERLAQELSKWLRRDLRELSAARQRGACEAQLVSLAKDQARHWEIASKLLEQFSAAHVELRAQSELLRKFPSPERAQLDVETQSDQRAYAENALEQARVRAQLVMLKLAEHSRFGDPRRLQAQAERLRLRQLALAELRAKLALEPDAPEPAPGFKRGPRQVGHGSDRELEARYLTLCKLGPLAPLRQALDRVEAGELAFEFEAGSLRGQLWRRLGELIGGRPYFVLGSTHQDDEVALARALTLLHTPPVMVVVPRDFARYSQVPALLRDLGLSVSSLCAETIQPSRSSAPAPAAIVVDAHGLLFASYQHALGAFIGGGLHGLRDHNYSEPLVFGTPTWTGPFHLWSPERWQLLQQHAPGLVTELSASQLARLAQDLEEITGRDAADAPARSARRRRFRPYIEAVERRAMSALLGLPDEQRASLQRLCADAGALAQCRFLEQFAAAGLVEHSDGFADYWLGVQMGIEGPAEPPKWIVKKHTRYLIARCGRG